MTPALAFTHKEKTASGVVNMISVVARAMRRKYRPIVRDVLPEFMNWLNSSRLRANSRRDRTSEWVQLVCEWCSKENQKRTAIDSRNQANNDRPNIREKESKECVVNRWVTSNVFKDVVAVSLHDVFYCDVSSVNTKKN